MQTIIYIIAAGLFLAAVAGHIYVKVRLRPKAGSDLDDYYHEFEDRHPEYARYTKWSRITIAAAAVSMLLLLIASTI
jgi:hypothetical protein